MSPRTNFVLLGSGCLGIAAIVCAVIAWTRIAQLSLPLPALLPALNISFPFITAFVFALARRLTHQAKQRAVRLTLPYLAHAATLLPFVIFVLSLVYATPGDIQTCGLEQHWLRMFEAKNDRAIRNVQTRLQCCGLNSIHDRAWPFPSRNVDARACERTQGYMVPCRGPWRNEEAFAATLTAVASLLNWLTIVVLTVINTSQDEGQIRLPAWSTSPRLIEGHSEGTEESGNNTNSEERSEQQMIWGESRNSTALQTEP